MADGGTPDDSFDVKVADDNPGTGDTVTVNVTIDSVNDAPTFSLPTNPAQTVDNDTTARTVAGFINTSTFDPGPNESSQAISDFVVSSDNTGLFASQPAVENDGTLTFTPADGVQGTATVDVQVILSDTSETTVWWPVRP